MTPNEAARVILDLLEHFDTHEGTTYLYASYDRDRFVMAYPEPLRSEVKRLLDRYHDQAS